MTIPASIAQPLIILLRAIIVYLEDKPTNTTNPDLEHGPNQCDYCARSSIPCSCTTSHCKYHTPKYCRSQAA
jgi:hypothetical protein